MAKQTVEVLNKIMLN